MTSRRRFLALLGVGTAAGPLAAKQALEAEQLSLTALSGKGTPLAYLNHGHTPAMSEGTPETYASAYNYVRMFGVPEHIKRYAREQSRYVQCLDPDLACKRSWSLAVKIQEQRARNYARQLEHYKDFNWYNRGQEAFAKVTGFKWPW